MKLPERDSDGKLPAFAWPGGYPIFYLDKQGNVLCPGCASREIDQAQEVTDSDVNWEDADLECDYCGRGIECAYPPDPRS